MAEGFQIYGEFGSVLGKLFNPWYLKSAEVECFSLRDGQFKRVLSEDGHFYRLQVESFADAVRGEDSSPAVGIEDGLAAVRVLRAIQLSVQKELPTSRELSDEVLASYWNTIAEFLAGTRLGSLAGQFGTGALACHRRLGIWKGFQAPEIIPKRFRTGLNIWRWLQNYVAKPTELTRPFSERL